MTKFNFGIFFLALATLVAELSLVRVFDALFYPNIAYFIISSAMFGLGLAGIYATLRPLPESQQVNPILAISSAAFAMATALFLPIMNLLPFDFNALFEDPIIQLIYFALMYVALLLPFFLAGLAITNLYSVYASKIQSLYFADLIGAALGSVIVIPFLPIIGPGGLLFCAAAFGLLASALFSSKRIWMVTAPVVAAIFIILPFARSPEYFDFVEHQDKRGVKGAREANKVETTIWDPISKIDVVDYSNTSSRLDVMYDGGSQQTTFFFFDGDFSGLREHISEDLKDHFWMRGVLASHYLLRDSDQSVLVIGSAGGQEIKAALMYGASQVDGVELVGAVVDLASNEYSDHIGNLFQHPNVNVIAGEGRSFIRASEDKYDIIQIFSNHTSSSVAAGVGAAATVYLQTAEAYQEYFEHLTENGILHINHHDYPRMITTAALAWDELGRNDFQKHVVVFQRDNDDDTLPTFLVKNQPWTEEELAELEAFFFEDIPGEEWGYELVENPLNPQESLLSPGYYLGELSPELIENAAYRIEPTTDNRPYFNFKWKSFFDTSLGLMRGDIDSDNLPLGVVALNLTGIVSLFFAGVFTLVPLFFSEVGRSSWANKGSTLTYFSCLGAGFIILEIVFIQIFMRLIGSPLHTYTTVLAILLLSAGAGSIFSRKLNISPSLRWQWPFAGIVVSSILLVLIFPSISQHFLASQFPTRILIAGILMLPVGFFLGMPFPLGILSLQQQPSGAIAWAWGMNGLFTVIGGLISIIISVNWGFNITLIFALSLYIAAFFLFAKIRLAA